jgi:hypothetical protein
MIHEKKEKCNKSVKCNQKKKKRIFRKAEELDSIEEREDFTKELKKFNYYFEANANIDYSIIIHPDDECWSQKFMLNPLCGMEIKEKADQIKEMKEWKE